MREGEQKGRDGVKEQVRLGLVDFGHRREVVINDKPPRFEFRGNTIARIF